MEDMNKAGGWNTSTNISENQTFVPETTTRESPQEWDGVPPFHHTIPIKVSYGLIGCIGMIGNALVIWVITSTPSLKSRLANRLIRHNSWIDWICSLLLLAIALTITNETIPVGGILGQIYCLIWMSRCLLWAFVTISTYSLVVLTFERYIGVVYPIWHKVYFSDTKVRLMLAVAWCIGLVTNIPQTAPTSMVINGKCALYVRWPSYKVREMTGIVTFFVLYLIPLLCLVYCYVHMILIIRRKARSIGVLPTVQPLSSNKSPSPNPAASKGTLSPGQPSGSHLPFTASPDIYSTFQWNRTKTNTIKTLAVVSICFAICWSSNSTYFFMFSLGYPADYASDFYHFTVVAIYFNCCINPIVFVIKYDQFRIALFKLLRKKWGRTGQSGPYAGSGTLVPGTSATISKSDAANTREHRGDNNSGPIDGKFSPSEGCSVLQTITYEQEQQLAVPSPSLTPEPCTTSSTSNRKKSRTRLPPKKFRKISVEPSVISDGLPEQVPSQHIFRRHAESTVSEPEYIIWTQDGAGI